MGKFAGLVLIAAGVGTAAYVYPMISSGPDRAEKQLADVVAISTSAIPASQANATATRPPVPVVVRPAPGVEAQRVVSAETSPGKLPLVPTPKSPVLAAIAPLPEAQPVARPIDVPQPQAAKRSGRNEDEARVALTREIQRELKRVGCFDGAADGGWNAETRQGMKTFIDRVNATLPIDEPDHILKTLVQGHPGNACGKSCPTGQAMAGDGKCLPTAIIAQSTKRPVARDPVARDAAAQRAPTQGAPTPAWDTRTTVAEAPKPAPAPAAAPTVRPEPLPGRMTVGAPTVTAAAPPPVAPADVAPDSRAKRGSIVLKPREPSPEPKVAFLTPAEKPTAAIAPTDAGRPPIGAIAAVEQPAKPTPRAAAVEPDEAARPAPRVRLAPQPLPPVAIYRAPPPRYVSTFTPPVYRERQRFGPQIFREMERSTR